MLLLTLTLCSVVWCSVKRVRDYDSHDERPAKLARMELNPTGIALERRLLPAKEDVLKMLKPQANDFDCKTKYLEEALKLLDASEPSAEDGRWLWLKCMDKVKSEYRISMNLMSKFISLGHFDLLKDTIDYGSLILVEVVVVWYLEQHGLSQATHLPLDLRTVVEEYFNENYVHLELTIKLVANLLSDYSRNPGYLNEVKRSCIPEFKLYLLCLLQVEPIIPVVEYFSSRFGRDFSDSLILLDVCDRRGIPLLPEKHLVFSIVRKRKEKRTSEELSKALSSSATDRALHQNFMDYLAKEHLDWAKAHFTINDWLILLEDHSEYSSLVRWPDVFPDFSGLKDYMFEFQLKKLLESLLTKYSPFEIEANIPPNWKRERVQQILLNLPWDMSRFAERRFLPDSIPEISKLIPRDVSLIQHGEYYRAIIAKYGYQRIYKAMSELTRFSWDDYFLLSIWAHPHETVNLGRCISTGAKWEEWVSQGREINPRFIEKLHIYDTEIKPAMIIEKFETLFKLKVDHTKAKEWIKTSKYFKPHDFGFLQTQSEPNQRNLLRALCHLDPGNPFMEVGKDRLIMEAEGDAQLSETALLKMFADGLGEYLGDIVLKHLDSSFTFSPIASAMIDALIKLQNADSPISMGLRRDLLYTLLIVQLAAVKVEFLDESEIYNRNIIEDLQLHQRAILPAHFLEHGLAVEVYRTEDDLYQVTIFNSGEGLREHQNYSDKRFQYFTTIWHSKEHIKNKRFFAHQDLSSGEFYKQTQIANQVSVNDLLESYSGQKRATCTAKSIQLIIKWSLKHDDAPDKYGLYLWWKAWHIAYRAKDIRRVISRSVETRKLVGLESKWKPLLFAVDMLADTLPIAEVIILHQCMRILADSAKLVDKSLQASIIKTLRTIRLTSELKKFFNYAAEAAAKLRK